MINVGDVISYNQMCLEEGSSMQRGMNFHHSNRLSVILMSQRPDAPYTDEVSPDGKVLIYEGHDAPIDALDLTLKQLINQWLMLTEP